MVLKSIGWVGWGGCRARQGPRLTLGSPKVPKASGLGNLTMSSPLDNQHLCPLTQLMLIVAFRIRLVSLEVAQLSLDKKIEKPDWSKGIGRKRKYIGLPFSVLPTRQSTPVTLEGINALWVSCNGEVEMINFHF